MEILEKIEEDFQIVSNTITKQNQNDKKAIINLVKTLNNELVFDLNNVLNTNNIVCPSEINEILCNMNDYTANKIDLLNNQVKEIINISLHNSLITTNTLENIETKYFEKMDEINLNNKKFKFLYDNVFTTYLYDLSIKYKLKNNVDVYKKTIAIIDSKKKELYKNFENIIDTKKRNAVLVYDKQIKLLIKNIMNLNNKIKKANIDSIKEYASNLINTNNRILINKYIKEAHVIINTEINNANEEIYKDKKSNKEVVLATRELIEYLLNYANSLYDKILKIFDRIVDIVYLDKKDMETTINKYNEMIYKIFNLEYNFDKPFLKYKNCVLKHQQLLKREKVIDNINEIIKTTDENISKEIKNNVVILFQKQIENLNSVLYKYLSIKDSSIGYIELISQKELEQLFK